MSMTDVTRADSLSLLQNLGKPLSKASNATVSLPAYNPVPSRLDFALDATSTRTKKCCKDSPPVDRFASELYPIPAAAARDLRQVQDLGGAQGRMFGRDPVAYKR